MTKPIAKDSTRQPSRRRFLQDSTALIAGTGLAAAAPVVHAAGSDVLRVGLVGCGGRGTGAAVQALSADANTKLVALADVFKDRLDKSLESIKQTKIADRVAVEPDRQFVGFDAYKQLIDSGVDVVLLATPPHFRPAQLEACVEAGKHVFVEKPVAVDAPGVRSVLASCEKAKAKKLSVVTGLCWRYETGMQETMKRIHDGAIGDIVDLQTTRYGQGVWVHPRQPGETDLEWQMRDWYYFTWLSGDFNVEQFVHELDKMAWAMKDEYPVRCYSTGGRQARVGPEYGHIYDHFSTVYEYANGTRLFAATRHQKNCSPVNGDFARGTKGNCELMRYTITGENPWKWPGKMTVMHQLEHDALFASIRKAEPINDGNIMAKSTMMAIIARMSAYTGKTLTWEQAMNSQERLGPETYDWNQTLPVPPVAIPGVTEFV